MLYDVISMLIPFFDRRASPRLKGSVVLLQALTVICPETVLLRFSLEDSPCKHVENILNI